MSTFTRRQLVRGAAGVSAAAAMHASPLLRLARAQTPPRRLLVFFSPLGAIGSTWMPSGTETGFTLGSTHAPLEPFKSDLILFNGLDLTKEAWDRGPAGGGNHQEMGGILTGRSCDGDDYTSVSSHISLDQHIAKDSRVTGGTPFKSIALAAWHTKYFKWLTQMDHMYMSALGPRQPVKPEGLPHAAFDQIFGGFTGPATGGGPPLPSGPDPRIARRKSVLDVVAADLAGVQARLGANARERAKIDQHLTSLRELERSLMGAPYAGAGGGGLMPAAGCATPAKPEVFRIDDDATLNQRIRHQIDISVAALACDRTRIVALTCEGGQSFAQHPWLGLTTQYHETTHGGDTKEQIAVTRWYGMEFAYLLGRLKAIKEGNGTLLDNTLVFWVTEQGCREAGTEHTRTSMPWLIAGRAGGALRTGRYLNVKGQTSNSLLISVMNAMGVAGNSFGEWSAPPIAGLAA